jgi:hypothetical protein
MCHLPRSNRLPAPQHASGRPTTAHNTWGSGHQPETSHGTTGALAQGTALNAGTRILTKYPSDMARWLRRGRLVFGATFCVRKSSTWPEGRSCLLRHPGTGSGFEPFSAHKRYSGERGQGDGGDPKTGDSRRAAGRRPKRPAQPAQPAGTQRRRERGEAYARTCPCLCRRRSRRANV